MNRRHFLASATALAAQALLPSWAFSRAPVVPLQEFCGEDQHFRGDLVKISQPFIQEEAGYATDAMICLRVPAREVKGEALGKLPPASGLPWVHQDLTGWKPWPRQNYLLADNSVCPVCNGYGTADGKCGQMCEVCGHTGREWVGSHPYQPIQCRACNGVGIQGPHCQACKGKAIGLFPGIQLLGQRPIDACYDRKIRKHLRDVEYATSESLLRYTRVPLVAFRFEGGVGLLAPRLGWTKNARVSIPESWSPPLKF
jgi:hypothetical protein